MIELTALWKATSKNGKNYLRGRLGNSVIMIFPNEKKTDEKHPDYRIVIGESQKQQAQKEWDAGKGPSEPMKPATTANYDSDSIPF